MGSFTDYLENKVLDHVVGKTSFTMPAVVAVALFTAAPSDAGGGTEVTNANNYARSDGYAKPDPNANTRGDGHDLGDALLLFQSSHCARFRQRLRFRLPRFAGCQKLKMNRA